MLPLPPSMPRPARTGSAPARAAAPSRSPASTKAAKSSAKTEPKRSAKSAAAAPMAAAAPRRAASASSATTAPAPAMTPPPPPQMVLTRPSGRPGPPPGIAIAPLPLVPAPDFKVGDKAVHPSHGVGEVTAIESRDIGGSRQNFYILRILDNAMKVMVPTSAATQVGLRGIMSDKQANDILSTMRAREVAVDAQPWSRRFRVYTEMIKSGSPVEIAKVLRDMNRLKFDKDLSFGERRLLDQARSLLLKELAFAKKKTEAEMSEEIKAIFSS